MKFRTELKPAISPIDLNLEDKLTSLGSCFSNMIGERMSRYKFDLLNNPFGVTFHPFSIFKHIESSLEDNHSVNQEYFLLRDQVYFHYLYHSDVSSPSKEDLEQLIEKKTKMLRESLKASKVLFLTFGTAFAYVHEELNLLVCNCHKQKQQLFRKKLFSAQSIVGEFDRVYEKLQKINPKLKIVLTVSPVRHLKEGLSENSLSKSILRVVAHELSEKYEAIEYFPSYELLLDDLRDYRFYASDMLHPSDQAEQYIWGEFQESYFSDKAKQFSVQWIKVLAALSHKVFYENTESHKVFINNTLLKISTLEKQFKLNLSTEKSLLTKEASL